MIVHSAARFAKPEPQEAGGGDLEEMLEMEVLQLVDMPDEEGDCNDYGRVGEVIEVWSNSMGVWFHAGIVEIISETDVLVEYGDMTRDGEDEVSAKVVDLSDQSGELWRRRPPTAMSALSSGSGSRPGTSEVSGTSDTIYMPSAACPAR